MAAEHVPVAQAPISGDDLVLLLDDLRLQRQFAIGIDEHLIAQELLATWQARGAGDAIGLRNWLAPVLCTNPEEQAEFYRHFDVWWSARTAIALEPAPPQRSSVLPIRPDASRSWVWLGFAAFMSLIVAAAIWNLARHSAQPSQGRTQTSTGSTPAERQPGSGTSAPSTEPSNTTGGQRPTPQPPAAGPEDDLTVVVNVLDRSGRVIPDASACLARMALTAPASTSTCLIRARTGQTGETELRAKVEDSVQVLVEHPAYESPAPFAVVQRTGRVSLRAQLAPRAPAWFTWLHRNTRWIQPLATLLPLLVAACWWGWLRSRRRIVLERRASSELGDQAPVSLPPAPRTLYLGDEFVRARVEARRSRAVGSGDLDIDATVERTLDRLGCFSPVYRLRRELPSYLALVDRSSYRDQHARMIDELLDRLVEGNVPIARYYFDRDPRMCAPASGEGDHRTLLELASLHLDHRLLLWSNGAGLTDAVTGRPAGWLDVLSSWSERALMTPLPVCHWSSREIDLSETGLRVVPASAAGLMAFAESLRNPEALSHSLQSETWVPPYPAILQEQPSGWTERNAPTDETIERLCRQLQRYLGVAGYRWLCALAVYPEVDWHLTVFMGLRLRRENGAPVLREDSLLALTRLPWLRHGSMPDWLRVRLIDELSMADEGAVRGFLRELLARRLDSSWSEFQLAVTKPPAATGKRWRRWLVDLLRTEPPGSPLQDRIFVTFVLGGQPHRLQVQAPRGWERWVYERGLRVLGVRAAPVAVLAVAVAAAGFATRKGMEALGPVIVSPGESRLGLALGVAVPALTGKPQNDAFEMLARIGLTYGTLTQRVTTGPVGVVLQQSPAPGAQIARGAAVDLVLSIPPTSPPAVETFPVTVNVMPWARFTITPRSSDTRVPPGPYETPAAVELPEGSYDFAFENGGVSSSHTLRVDVSRDGNNSVRFNLPGFDPNAALNAILGTAGP